MKLKIALLLVFIAALVQGGSNIFPGKVWILFRNRPYLQHKQLSAAQAGLTQASLNRRLVRGFVRIDEADFPVDPGYLRAVQSAGAIVKRESRWLNGVSAVCDATCQSRVAAFPFVAEIRPVIIYHRKTEPIVMDNQPATMAKPYSTESLNYGPSKDQLVQLSVPAVHNQGFAGQGEIVAIFDSGFRKDHIAFKNHTIVAEHDYVFDDDNVQDGGDFDSHGTGTWSCVGGSAPGKLFGPAYKASFILAVTEDIRTETMVEEDNWVAAFEMADRLGATVISSSLGYSDWYTKADFNGTTAITSRVASTAAQKGIVVVNSAGNEGPGASTLSAPADAKNIVTVGAVDFAGQITNFSSRGPTADGRIKPEVVARGFQTFLAGSFSPTAFTRASGTSFSCPLVAGCAATLLSAHPEWTPLQVREALMKTASRTATPDNTYGWGIVNLAAAVQYVPANSIVITTAPLKNTTNASQPYKVVARIRAFRGLNTTQLFVFWRRSGATTFQQIALTPTGVADQFQALIPSQSKGTVVQYYISAKDSKGKIQKSPFKAPIQLYSFSIL